MRPEHNMREYTDNHARTWQKLTGELKARAEAGRQASIEAARKATELAQTLEIRTKLEQAAQAVPTSPQQLESALLASRAQRLQNIETPPKNFFKKTLWRGRRFFRKTLIGKFVNTGIQMMPGPVLWGLGIGDLITGASALAGQDIISGEKLDWVGRGLYTVATFFPLIPGTVLVGIFKRAREGIEETAYHRKYGDTDQMRSSAIQTGKHLKDLVGIVNRARKR